jgi:hypothetical protein
MRRRSRVAIIWRDERRERRFGILLQREEELGMRMMKWEKWKKNYVRRGKSYIHTYS